MNSSEIQAVKNRFGIIGTSPVLNHAINVAIQVAATDLTVLITGESGSGKESFSKIIHSISSRKHGPFIAINCGAIPEGTIDSELFGHEKGAFTGALDSRKGYFETTNGGTIFLDEVGEMPFGTQSRLLRVLENGEYIRVGSSKVMKTNVRVVAATNVNLLEAVNNGKFREDLYYRLNVIPIQIPALRERKTDIPLLLNHFLTCFNKNKAKSISGFSAEAMNCLVNYAWPGNIRELENLVERLSILKGHGEVAPQDLPPKYKSAAACYAETGSIDIPEEGLDFNNAVDQFENALIIKALEKTGWNKNQAAMLLRLNRTTLVEKMKKKGLRSTSENSESEMNA